MKNIFSLALAAIGLSVCSQAFAQNLLTNPGWDDQAASVTLTDAFDSTTFTDWQMYSLGGSCTYNVIADASAPSAPNILVYSKPVSVGDSAIRKDPFKSPLTAGNIYLQNLYIRDVDATKNTVNIATGVFDELDGFMQLVGAKTVTAGSNWKKISSYFVAPDGAASGSFQIHFFDATADVQIDSAELIEIGADYAGNLVLNSGFDAEAATVTVGAAEAAQFDTNNTFTDWQVYALGNAPAHSIFTTQADANAKSAPNVMVFNKIGGPGDSAIRSEASQFPIIGDNIYISSFWARGTVNGINHFVGLFDGDGAFISPFGDSNLEATANWQKHESSWKADATAVKGSFQLRLNAPDATNQFDDVSVLNVTKSDRMTNGGFENSTTALPGWNVVDFNGRGFAGAVVPGAGLDGGQAVRVSQTAATAVGSDGVFAKDAGPNLLPWLGTNEAYLRWSQKDDTTSDTAETVNVSLACFDVDKAFLGLAAVDTQSVTDSWTSHTLQGAAPVGTAFISVNIRIGNGAGTNVDVDDVLLDGFVLGDLTAGYEIPTVPVTAARREWQLYE